MILLKLLYKLFLGIIYCSVFAYYFVLTVFKDILKKTKRRKLFKSNMRESTIDNYLKNT